MRRIPTHLAASLLMLAPAARGEETKPHVVASFSILADMAREIGGDRIAVATLVGPDGDAHVYQPAPADARELSGATLFVMNGLGLEGWLDRLVTAAGYKGRIVTAAVGVTPIEDDGAADPHAWQDVGNAEHYAIAIADGLIAADPSHEGDYRTGLARYEAELASLDSWVREQIASVPPEKRRIITTHDAFAYFARAYGIRVEAPVGMTEESEPSAAAVATLIRRIRQDGTKALFIENMTDPRLIAEIAAETGGTTSGTLFADALSRPGEGGETYVAMIRHNVAAMVAAMQRNG